MSTKMAASHNSSNMNLINSLTKWLEPKSKNRDEAFRERSIRIAITLVMTLGVLSFILTVFWYRNEWSLISSPTVHIVLLVGFAASAYIVSHGQIVRAAWLVVLTTLIGAFFYLLVIGGRSSNAFLINGMPFFLLVMAMASLMLPRNSIWIVTLLALFFYGLSVIALHPIDPTQSNSDVVQPLTTALLLIPGVGVILNRLRVEFDARLDAMSDSIRQTEIARQQAEEARQQAERARKEAEEADKAKSQFLANMSHELRTPLNAIIGYDEAMLGGMVGDFTPNQSKLLGHIQHNSRRLLGLINDVLDLSKIESGSLQVFLSPISPHKVIGETVESLRSLADQKKIDLRVQFSDAVPEVVLGDTNKLQQILVNLLSNAIKFTDEGGVTVNVSIVDTTRWLMEVRDTGIGMPEDAISTIFEPFHQLDTTDKRKYKGTGLGLAITKRLIESLGGTVEVKSKLGEGSTFSITLPRAQIPEVAAQPQTATKEIAS